MVKDIKDNNGFININNVVNNLETEHNSEFLEGMTIVNIAIGTKRERTRF